MGFFKKVKHASKAFGKAAHKVSKIGGKIIHDPALRTAVRVAGDIPGVGEVFDLADLAILTAENADNVMKSINKHH